MDRDFFVKLAFGTHRVAEFLPEKERMKQAANKLLADLLLFCDDNPVTIDQKKNILPKTLQEIEAVLALLNSSKNVNTVPSKAFFILEKEYQKIPAMLIAFLEQNRGIAPKPQIKQHVELSMRQKKIVELLQNKEKVQVWELQKIMPEVTKRTLRRDLDDLLKLNIIERKGEWNNVFYTIKK